MLGFSALCLGTLRRALRGRRSLLLENLALRQQLVVLKRQHPRPRLGVFDKFLGVAACRFWSKWKPSLIVVTPETVVRWHRAVFRLYWRLISRVRKPVGRRRTSKEIRELIFRRVAENPTWGAPHIHGELLMLGLELSERTVSRWMKRAPRSPDRAQRWRAFLRSHREAIAAMDLFTVPTLTFRLFYCFFVISHARRRILHLNVTRHPTGTWIIQQLGETFPFESVPKYSIFDRDAKYGVEIPAAVRPLIMDPVRTPFGSPCQNGVAERWVGSCRRELLHPVIAINEHHLKRRLSDYLSYYHEDRRHLGLGKETPNLRGRSRAASGHIVCQERLGGLHHRYDRAA